MASQSLYRKWRSQTFDELVGQAHVVQTLRNAIAEDRVAHAYLFTGPRGVGKTSMARLVAKAVNCTAPPPQRPCGQCDSCRTIANGRAVDIIEMDAASHTSVDDAREIIERVQFRPTSGRYKVYVIDEVHMLSTAAFNALLKTLEEPPDHAIFILATTEAHKVPATILSRCQRFTFTRHSLSDMADHLSRIASAEGMHLEEGVSQAIARAATGSMRDALGTLEQLGSFGSGTISTEQVHNLLGMTASTEIDSLIEALLANDVTSALHIVNSIADQGSDMRQFARDLVERLRALLLLVATQDHTLIDASADDLALLRTWAQQAEPALLVQWIRHLSSLDYQLRVSPYGHLPLELALVEALLAPAPPAAAAQPARPAPAKPARPAAPKPAPKPAASEKARPAANEPATTKPSPAPAAPAEPAAPPAEPAKPEEAKPAAKAEEAEPAAEPAASAEEAPPAPVTPPPQDGPPADAEPHETAQAVSGELSLLERVEEVWPNVVRDVRPHNNRLQAMLRDVYPVDVEGNTVVLLAKYAFHKNQIERPKSRQIIEKVLSTYLGSAVAVACILHQEERTVDTRSLIKTVRNDPRVKAARNIFGAEIIDVVETEEPTTHE